MSLRSKNYPGQLAKMKQPRGAVPHQAPAPPAVSPAPPPPPPPAPGQNGHAEPPGIPHSPEAEKGALGCVLLAATTPADQGKPAAEAAQRAADDMLQQLRPGWFFDVRFKLIFAAAVEIRGRDLSLSLHSLSQYVKDHHKAEHGQLIPEILTLTDAAATQWQFADFLSTLRDKWLRRWTLAKRERLTALAADESLSAEAIQAEFADLSERAGRAGSTKAPRLKIWRAAELAEYKVPPHLRLVGDNELALGYEGLVVIAGPGAAGKSLAANSLALAGAMGRGTWFGRTIHRQFGTLILQAENGTLRLKSQMEAMIKENPHLREAIEKKVAFSSPPDGGLPFHDADFRRAVRAEWDREKYEVVIIDPWSHTATEDDAAAVVEKIHMIRSCFPGGDECPCICIVCHTKKPRPEDVRRGRGLVYMVSGSIALCNTARTVYMLLPFTDAEDDHRILWATPKINNGAPYAPSVWFRRFGTLFEADPATDASTWGQEERTAEESRAITPEHVAKAFEGLSVLKKSDLAKRLEKICGAAYPTVMRAITPGRGGYLAGLFEATAEGWLMLRKEEA